MVYLWILSDVLVHKKSTVVKTITRQSSGITTLQTRYSIILTAKIELFVLQVGILGILINISFIIISMWFISAYAHYFDYAIIYL